MPVMDGIAAYHEIRKINKTIPVVAVTAYATENEKHEIMQYGFSDYLSKPVGSNELLKILSRQGWNIAAKGQSKTILIADDDKALAKPAARQSPISWNATFGQKQV